MSTLRAAILRRRRRRNALLSQGGAAPIVYLLRDEFTIDASAPLTSPRTAEPGPGTLTLVQTDGQFSISGGKLAFPAQTTPTYGDQGIIGSALTRVAGRTLIDSFNMTTVDEVCILGWMNTNTLNYSNSASISHVVRFFTTALVTQDKSASAIAQAGAPSTSTDYKLALVLRSTGCFALINGGSYTDWTLFWIFADNSATVYPVFSNYAAAGTLDYIRVTDLAAPFDTDYGIAVVDVDTFTQSLGAELLTNGDFETGDPPTGWGSGGSTLSSAADERTGGSGSSSLNVARNNNDFGYGQQIITTTIGGWYELRGWYKNVDASSGAYIRIAATPNIESAERSSTTWHPWTVMTRRGDTQGIIRSYSHATVDGQSARFDDFSFKPVTLNAEATAVADGIFDFTYALPASPYSGERVELWYRANGDTDYWTAYLKRNDANDAWDFKVDSVSNGTATNRVNVTGVGTPTTIRVITSGTSHDFYTLASSTWTKRGSTVTNATHQTNTGVRAIYASTVTPSRLTVYPRTHANYAALEAI